MQLNQTMDRNDNVAVGEQILGALFPENSPWTGTQATVMTYGKDELIYAADDPSDALYFISEGRVKIGCTTSEGKNIIKSILTENDLFGEMALTGEVNRIDHATALEDNTKVYSLKKDQILQFMKDNDSLSFQILRILGARVRRTEKRLESLLHKDARTRIIEFIKDLAIEKGQKVGFETMIKNHFTHKDMASLTGTSRQTVTTVLNSLKEKNIINFDRRRILIRDLDLLV